jgi:hypothetical protein
MLDIRRLYTNQQQPYRCCPRGGSQRHSPSRPARSGGPPSLPLGAALPDAIDTGGGANIVDNPRHHARPRGPTARPRAKLGGLKCDGRASFSPLSISVFPTATKTAHAPSPPPPKLRHDRVIYTAKPAPASEVGLHHGVGGVVGAGAGPIWSSRSAAGVAILFQRDMLVISRVLRLDRCAKLARKRQREKENLPHVGSLTPKSVVTHGLRLGSVCVRTRSSR